MPCTGGARGGEGMQACQWQNNGPRGAASAKVGSTGRWRQRTERALHPKASALCFLVLAYACMPAAPRCRLSWRQWQAGGSRRLCRRPTEGGVGLAAADVCRGPAGAANTNLFVCATGNWLTKLHWWHVVMVMALFFSSDPTLQA